MGSDTGALIPAGGNQPAIAGGHIPPPQNNEAEQLLLAWPQSLERFVKVMPDDYARVLAERAQADAEAAIAGD